MNEKFVQPGDGIEVVSKAGPIRERIMALLKDAAEGLDDDRLTMNLGLSHRQQVSAICRDLVQKGLVERRSVAGKIRNFWIGTSTEEVPRQGAPLSSTPAPKPWWWEGRVQDA